MMFVNLSDLATRVILKIVLIGDTGVGKTTLMNKYVHRRFDEKYQATIGADYALKQMSIDEKLVTLEIWDTAGQEMYHSIGVKFYRGAHCCILVYDINSAKSFGALDKWADEFIKQSRIEKPDTFPFILIGNKFDVDDGARREVSEAQAKEWCKSKGNIPYYETSAKDGRNVDAAFLDIIKTAVAILHKEIYKPTEPTLVLGETSEPTANNNSGCSC